MCLSKVLRLLEKMVMKEFVNHFTVEPSISLTDEIKAVELISPDALHKLSAHKIWIPGNSEYPPHQHPSPHLIFILEGGGYFRSCRSDDKERHPLKAGDVFYIPENAPHQVGADIRGMVMMVVSVGAKSLTSPERMKILPSL
jgi:quercetin dioxygenase-like cupin family protein